jgi:hypothetical protein
MTKWIEFDVVVPSDRSPLVDVTYVAFAALSEPVPEKFDELIPKSP